MDAFDIRGVAARINAQVGSTQYLLELDLNQNGVIDAFDFRSVVALYGQTCVR